MAFCTQCGKNLNEGEVCDCKLASDNQNLSSTENSVAVSVKNTNSIPYVSEILGLFQRTISKNTVKQVSLSAKNNSILWTFVVLIQCFINSLALSFITRNVVRKLLNTVLNSNPFTSGADTAKMLKNMGLGFFSLFFRVFFMGIIIFFIISGLIYLLLKVCKKNGNFNNIANMVSTATIPFTVLVIAGFIVSFILPQITLLIYFVAIISVLLLMYLGIQKIDKFTESPFWAYMILVFVMLIGCYLTISLLAPSIKLDNIFSIF